MQAPSPLLSLLLKSEHLYSRTQLRKRAAVYLRSISSMLQNLPARRFRKGLSEATQITAFLHKESVFASFRLQKFTRTHGLELTSTFGQLRATVEYLELDPLSRTLVELEAR